MRILVLTRTYPSADDLYQYPFVHRRVLAYSAAGHDVTVFRPTQSSEHFTHSYEGIHCDSGDERVLNCLVADLRPDVVAAHGFTELMYPMFEAHLSKTPTCAWLHGSEIPAFFRQKALAVSDPEVRFRQLDAVRERSLFWHEFLSSRPDRFRLVFPSHSAVELAKQDMRSLDQQICRVIPNPIDTDLFKYSPKTPGDRYKILLIRPFDSWTYGNDLAVSAILQMTNLSEFDKFDFTIVGDGPLFEETLAPLPALQNIRVERRFLTQPEIADYHSRHGIFLVPSRLDTQGVSRDEAMSSGLVPVTNRIPAVMEFVDESCAGICAPNSAAGLAEAIMKMAASEDLFLARSREAAARVRSQSGHERVIPAELDLLAELARG